ncbi:MAG: acetate--CoA ligase [Pseudomonadota bacterium]|nr:acetate--CoA ligase [Gammaproteobacteria bacterium]MEE2684326.1 acetate--CoA ligase [Pseudomonadota bacterium]|tara:strand:+ start:2510 stop:4453 length:1944 start_codon:yes stop_codon:yes gene_type:complete
MSKEKIYHPQKSASGDNYFDIEKYQSIYKESIRDPDSFWGEKAKELSWIQPYSEIKNVSYEKNSLKINWFADGVINACYNCLDRHLANKSEKIAIIWEGDNPNNDKKITYQELYEEVCKLANGLKSLGVKKGDRVTIYLPMIPEATISMLACARIGAIHSVVFGGFSPEALRGRIEDCESNFIITADEGVRGNKKIPLKKNVDDAIEALPENYPPTKVLVVQHSAGNINWQSNRDNWYHELLKIQEINCPIEKMSSEDPLFILYTSGSTGKPKGVLHTTAGYLLYASITHKYVFNYHDEDIYWCTADVGWVTGHSYIVYGPLANGATTLMFEGVPNYPSASRFWEVIDKHKVNIFYTAPTAIRALMREGNQPVNKTSRKSLKILGTVGEPINPEAWQWYYDIVGEKNCPIVDTWWQTETGGILITPLPGSTSLKPGSATLPFFGVQPAIVDDEGNILEGECSGNLVLLDSWPGQMRTVYGDHKRFYETYFSQFPGKYFSGDGAYRDKDGYYWITGRVDDVINISGHRIGSAEVESALVSHKKIAESAVVGFNHEIKGQAIYAYVTLVSGLEPSESLKEELIKWVRKEIGPIATPDKIQWAPGLPKTRSGKIMRRILRKIANDDYENLGDISTLADPNVVDELIKNKI